MRNGTGTERVRKGIRRNAAAFLPLLFLLSVGAAGCGMEEIASIWTSAGGAPAAGEAGMEAPALLEPVDVKMDVAEAKIGEIYKVSVYKGEMVPHTEELHFLVDGYLDEVNVMAGDLVQEGDVLLSLSEEGLLEQAEALEEEMELLARQGEFSDRLAEADIAIARRELEYIQTQEESGKSADMKKLEIQRMELSLREDRELRNLELEQRKASLDKLKAKLGKNEILAPFSGRVVYVSGGRKGDPVQAYVPMLYIADESRLTLSTEYVSEETVRSAAKVFARILDRELQVSYIPYGPGELVRMMLAGEKMKARFSVDAQGTALSAGQFAVVMLYQSYKEGALTVPVNALYRDGSGQYVYLPAEGGRVRRSVKTGMVTDTEAEILEGLEEGDMVYVKD